MRGVTIALLAVLVPSILGAQEELPLLVIEKPGQVIRKSCRVRIPDGLILRGTEESPALRIEGENLTVALEEGSTLRGASKDTPPDRLVGIGLVLDKARKVQLWNWRVRGYKVGLLARDCEELSIHWGNFAQIYHQRLRSTPKAEDPSDWLSPHHNDEQQWRKRYGAALCFERCRKLLLDKIRVRRSQNGIILDRVTGSSVQDCDASFLSGWGLALWRSSRNFIYHNAFDFCVRGYSHGIYNRGQDSAGILIFEQSSGNWFGHNSCTHGGDGVFGFAGLEALESDEPRGCNDNSFFYSDFSYAAAHGLEMTFSFDNVIGSNRFVGNAICGIWGGYCQKTKILDNHFEANGDGAYGLERGGVNIEHGFRNVITNNDFVGNRCGVHLWDDEDKGLHQKPWYRANHQGCREDFVTNNRFRGDRIAIQLRGSKEVTLGRNVYEGVEQKAAFDDASETRKEGEPRELHYATVPLGGASRPVGARAHLAGRENIIMTEWGPWDHETPLLRLVSEAPNRHRYEVLGPRQDFLIQDESRHAVATLKRNDGRQVLEIGDSRDSGISSYEVVLRSGDLRLVAKGTLISATWSIRFFPWKNDPREKLEAWRKEGESAKPIELPHLDLPFNGGGPSDLGLPGLEKGSLPSNHFGTIATTTIPLDAGKWRIRTLSDDGVRVTVNGKAVIENWSWHAPTQNEGVLTLEEKQKVPIRVEHFELDGHAVLRLEIEKIPAQGR